MAVADSTATDGFARLTSSGFLDAMSRPGTTFARALFCCVVVQAPASSPSARSAAGTSPIRALASAEGTAHVVLRPLLARRAEDRAGARVLDHLAEVHERDVVRDPVGLLEVVRDDHDRHVLAQLDDQVLDH